MKNHIRISSDVEASINRCSFDGNTLVMPDPNFVKFDNWPAMKKVFDALGGKWNKKAKAVVFPSDAKSLLSPAVAQGSVLDKKKQFQFFSTPLEVAQLMLVRAVGDIPCEKLIGKMMEPYRVLEPSAGTGELAEAVRVRFPYATVDCIEIQPEFRAVLRDKMLFNVIGADFLKQVKNPVYDFVIMNPPFAGGQDAKHVTHAFGFLKPGGRLVSVMSSAVRNRTGSTYAEFGAFLIANGGVTYPLPPKSFSESGTDVNACLVVLDRKGKS